MAAIDGTSPHRWRFYRVGGLDQVALETAADLAHLDRLDQKLWVALSCPVKGLEIDERTLSLLDLDQDGRVRAPEILAAVRWCTARLKDLGVLVPGGAALPLDAIDDGRPEGRALLGAARRVLASRGRGEAREVTPEDVRELGGVFKGSLFNGDGVVPPEAAEDEATRQAMRDAMACAGATPDRGGLPGLDQARLDAFWAELQAFDEWQRTGEVGGVLALGAGTPAAWEAVQAVRAQVDDWFARCHLAAFDPRGAALLHRTDAELQALAAHPLSAGDPGLAALPLARVEAGRALPLEGPVNPAWAAALANLRKAAVEPAWGQGRSSLAADEWAALQVTLAPYAAWMAARRGASVAPLGATRVRALLAGGDRAAIEALLARDLALEAEGAAVADVARMVHYRRDLHLLLRNFVAFADFYDPARRAIFQAGTLYLDGRSCDLCLKVDDPAAHAALAGQSRMFLAYLECRRPAGERIKIAACFTQGDSDYLTVGRNGLFYDRQGRDWDATIVRLVENPISIRQAFFSPYKKVLRLIEDQVARFAAAKEKEADAHLAAAAGSTGDAALGRPPPKAEPVDVGRMVGIIAALGVGAGAVGALFGGFVSGVMGLQPWWAKLVALGGMVLVVSGPSMLIAWLKLRQRNLGPVLDASGWAVNGRVKVNLPLGAALTARASLPPGASRSLDDPFEDLAARRRRRLFWLAVVVAATALLVARVAGRWPFAPPPGG